MEPMYLLVFAGGLAVGIVAALMFAGPSRARPLDDPLPPTSSGPASCALGVVTIPCTDSATVAGLTFMEYRSKMYSSDPGAPTYPGDTNTQPVAGKCPIKVNVGDVATVWVAVWARYCAYSTAVVVKTNCGG